MGFVSLTEALDLTAPAGRAMAGLLAIFAEFEKEILRERTRTGLAHARENGKRLGRLAPAALHTAEIRKLHRAGVSKAEIARRLEAGRTSVRRILAIPLRNRPPRLLYAGSPKAYGGFQSESQPLVAPPGAFIGQLALGDVLDAHLDLFIAAGIR
jgi:hypothetical protein